MSPELSLLLLQGVWRLGSVLRKLRWSYSTILCSWFLCLYCDAKMVESVCHYSVAWSYSCVCQLQYTWAGTWI